VVAAPHQRTSASRPLPVAADTRRLQKCLRRTATVRTPTNRPGTDRGSGSSSGPPRRPRCPVPRHPDTGRGVGLPGRRRQACGGPAAAVPARRQRRARCACSSALVKGPGRRSRRIPAVRTRGHRTRPAGQREPACPGTSDTRDHGRVMRTLRKRPRWTAGSRAVHRRSHVRPERDRNVRHRPAPPPDHQIRSLVLSVHGGDGECGLCSST
jgi:hypothetical protein